MNTQHILIVDDEVALAQALGEKLKSGGYLVEVSHSGEVALELLRNHRYDLILLDILMPGINGWEVLEELQGKGQSVIVISNLSQPSDRQKSISLGAKDYWIKSEMSLAEMVEHIRAFLALQAAVPVLNQ